MNRSLKTALYALCGVIVLGSSVILYAHENSNRTPTNTANNTVRDAPKGWFMAGSKPKEYEFTLDNQTVHGGKSSLMMKFTGKDNTGFGTVMQSFAAENYRGKRVRFSAFVKTNNVEGWAGLWMRIDGDDVRTKGSLAFDNMQNRSIKGTKDWQKYDVVLNVPNEAAGIFFGIILDGKGQLWMDDVQFEPVGLDVPTTDFGTKNQKEPENLNFEK
jgi:hypothetical protein